MEFLQEAVDDADYFTGALSQVPEIKRVKFETKGDLSPDAAKMYENFFKEIWYRPKVLYSRILARPIGFCCFKLFLREKSITEPFVLLEEVLIYLTSETKALKRHQQKQFQEANGCNLSPGQLNQGCAEGMPTLGTPTDIESLGSTETVDLATPLATTSEGAAASATTKDKSKARNVFKKVPFSVRALEMLINCITFLPTLMTKRSTEPVEKLDLHRIDRIFTVHRPQELNAVELLLQQDRNGILTIKPESTDVSDFVERIKILFSGSCLPLKEDLTEVSLGLLQVLVQSYFLDFMKHSLFLRSREEVVPTMDNFRLLRALGKGGFATVQACKKRDNGIMYAMKLVAKRAEKDANGNFNSSHYNELEFLKKADCPFIVKLNYAFQTHSYLILVLDSIVGGDFATHLERYGPPAEADIKIYAAQLAIAMMTIHNLGFVYRDLKPHNIMLDLKGHLKLVDFGLATKNTSSQTRCGTRGCDQCADWAPEVINATSGDRIDYVMADWWSFGCVIYELLTGICLFRSPEALKYDKDKNRSIDKATVFMQLDFGNDPAISTEAADLLHSLLKRCPNQRLGNSGHEAIQNHPFFSSINWEHVLHQKVETTHRPKFETHGGLTLDHKMGRSISQRFKSDETPTEIWGNWDYINVKNFHMEEVALLNREPYV